jgi:arabinose-5-phosphate isomerase
MTAVVNSQSQLIGIFTDGDLRRSLDNNVNLHSTLIDDVMTPNGTTVTADMLAAECLQIMETKKINALIVTNETNQPIGALNMHDLLKAGVI